MFQDVPDSSVENGSGQDGNHSRNSYFYMVRLNKCSTVPVNEIESYLKDFTEKYIFQLELGDNGIEHYQIFLKFSQKKRRNQVRTWLQNNLAKDDEVFQFPNGSYCEIVKSWIKASNYCCKEETRVGGVYTHNIVLKNTIVFPELYAWQKKIVDEVLKKADDRKIIHVNKTYCAGKSLLGRYLIIKHDALIVDGNENHILALVAGKPDVKVIVMDCAADNKPVAFGAVEKIKNGYFASHFGTKGTKMVLLNQVQIGEGVHIIIFSNNSLEKDLKV